MIKKLRKKMIFSTMLSLFTVLFVILGVVNFINFQSISNDADSVLSLIEDRDKTRPPERSINWKQAGPRFKSPEMPFEIRFFSIILDEDGKVDDIITDRIAAVNEETANEYAQLAMRRQSDRGFIGDYRYLRVHEENSTSITLLDCGRMLMSARYTTLYSILISLIGLAAVFLLILILSGRIIKPFLDNYEKQRLFVTDAGHEIKTPLTVISADAELIEMETGGSEWLSDIKVQCSRMAGLTDRLIRLTRTERPDPIEMIDFPISDLISDTVASFRAPAKTQEKTITAEIQPMLSYCGNENDIRQLIGILLENAIKYSPDGSEIRVSFRKQNRQLLFVCENKADSIPEGLTRHMFDRFYRGDASRSSRTSGYGIGLSIARAIVEAHRGRIRAETENGNTVRVLVSLQTPG